MDIETLKLFYAVIHLTRENLFPEAGKEPIIFVISEKNEKWRVGKKLTTYAYSPCMAHRYVYYIQTLLRTG